MAKFRGAWDKGQAGTSAGELLRHCKAWRQLEKRLSLRTASKCCEPIDSRGRGNLIDAPDRIYLLKGPGLVPGCSRLALELPPTRLCTREHKLRPAPVRQLRRQCETVVDDKGP
jgi:hypothetical protein